MNTSKNHHKKYQTTLYSVVFDSFAVRIGVVLLFAFLLLQPVSLAFASEEVSDVPEEPAMLQPEETPNIEVVEQQNEEVSMQDEPAVTETEPEEVVSPQDTDVVPEEEVPDEEEIVETESEPSLLVGEEQDVQTEVSDTDNIQSEETSSATSTATQSGGSEEPSVTEEPIQTTENSEIPVPEEELQATTTTQDIETTEPEEPETQTPYVPVLEESASTTEATSTETEVIVDHNTSAYEFDTSECASVGDGTFYCSSAENVQEFEEDGVFSAPDADGDMEIFVRLNGEESQLTSNTIDDSAPYYDGISERIVWHAVYHDRYQVVSFDMNSGDTTVITDTNYNNMEPVAYGDITLWQAWIDNNWEIMMHDGDIVRQLTNNTLHDVSPHMRDEHIVWQTQFADGWQVALYDQQTGDVAYVRSEGGAKVENPRFVLVYDSTNEAGDIQTIGYDFDNKRSFTLSSIPADLPEELPEPDQTGETRALIQNKQTPKSSEIEELEPQPQGNTATSTENDGLPTLDLTASSTSPVLATSSPAVPVEDLVIESPTTTPETIDVSHIPDVVIPPDLATSSAEVR